MYKHTEETGEGFGDFYCEQLREQLIDFDDEHLKKLVVLYYDRWNWETGTKNDLHFIRLVEQVLEERNIGLRFYISTDDEIIFNVNHETVCIRTEDGQKYELLGVYNGILEIGFDLKKAFIDLVYNEIRNSGAITSSGHTIGFSFEALQNSIQSNENEINMLREEIKELREMLKKQSNKTVTVV